jgi:hypothetical protein
MQDKIKKLLSITTSQNDQEALAALRSAQRLAHNLGLDITMLSFDDQSPQNNSQAEIWSLKMELQNSKNNAQRLRNELSELQEERNKLFEQNERLKDKIKPLQKDKKEEKETNKFFKEMALGKETEIRYLTEDLHFMRSMLQDIACHPDGAGAFSDVLVREFVKKYGIKSNEKSWISTRVLYEEAKDFFLFRNDVSIAKFSRSFAKVLKLEPKKWGKTKDKSGFFVSSSRIHSEWYNEDPEIGDVWREFGNTKLEREKQYSVWWKD